jgi:hypothetical protein
MSTHIDNHIDTTQKATESTDIYQYIDSRTRFNKQTGAIEIFYFYSDNGGVWKNKIYTDKPE